MPNEKKKLSKDKIQRSLDRLSKRLARQQRKSDEFQASLPRIAGARQTETGSRVWPRYGHDPIDGNDWEGERGTITRITRDDLQHARQSCDEAVKGWREVGLSDEDINKEAEDGLDADKNSEPDIDLGALAAAISN